MGGPSAASSLIQSKAALLDRIRAFASVVTDRRTAGEPSSVGMRQALAIFEEYTTLLARTVLSDFGGAPDDTIRQADLSAWNAHLKSRADFFDQHFRRGDRRVPRSIADAIERTIRAFGGTPTTAVVTIGRPDNFVTFTPDLRGALLDGLAEVPPVASASRLLLITVPEAEGTRISWAPIVCGHELAHFLQRIKPVGRSHSNELDAARVRALRDIPRGVGSQPPSRVLEQIAANWLEELTCDAYAVHTYGAATPAALTDFLTYVSPASTASTSHPPRALRTRLMLHWLGQMGGDALGIASALSDLIVQDVALPDWADLLVEHFGRLQDEIWSDVSGWAVDDAYDQPSHASRIRACSAALIDGVPPVEHVSDGESELLDLVDIVNGTWLSFITEPDTPANQLALKAADVLDFLSDWIGARGALTAQAETSTVTAGADAVVGGALSAAEIRRRLARTDAKRLRLIPRLPPEVADPSIDLRLGNQFIVFERSSLGQFDALDAGQSPRAIQAFIEKPWGDVFYLHPGQLVLAATLEYLVMPADLAGQVITRSSYGRLGLLSATAVQVHPRYAGCLTLELVNLGEVPMAITPGERVAQLMLWNTGSDHADTVLEDRKKYRGPTGPEFSKIRDDDESAVLRRIRERFRDTR